MFALGTLAVSVRVALEEYPNAREQQDLEVQRQRPVLDVVDVIEGAVADRCRATQIVDLGPASEARADPLPFQVTGDVEAVLLVEEGRLRARAHTAHVAFHDVDQLRQLVKARSAQEAAESRGARVAGLRDHGAGLPLGIRDHRPEFVDDERSAIKSGAFLPEKHGTLRRRELDERRHHEQHGAEDDKSYAADGCVQPALDDGVEPCQLVVTDSDERHAVDGVDVDTGAHHVEQVRHDLELQLLVLAEFDEVQQQRPVASRQCEENLVDVQLIDQSGQVLNGSHDAHAGELRAWWVAVIRDTNHVVPVLWKHAHSLNEHLAAGTGADHQHALGADALPAQPRLVLAQQIALSCHQHDGQQDRVRNRQPGVIATEVAERDHGQDQDRGEADPAV